MSPNVMDVTSLGERAFDGVVGLPMHELATPLPMPGEIIAGRYRLDTVIGLDAASALYEVTLLHTGERLALRYWLAHDPAAVVDATRRFMRQSQLFDHGCTLKVLSVGAREGAVYAVTERLEGVPLVNAVEGRRGLAACDACAWFMPCLEAVVASHVAGIVHGDVRPANVFLERSPLMAAERPRLLSFGLGGAPAPVRRLLGRELQFLTPEELRRQPIDERSDVYALGALLYFLLSGRAPFAAHGGSVLASAIASGTVRPLPMRVDRELAEVVERAMACDPARRFQSSAHMLRAMTRLDPHPTSQKPQAERVFVWIKPATAFASRFEDDAPERREARVRAREAHAVERRRLLRATAIVVAFAILALAARLAGIEPRAREVRDHVDDKARALERDGATHAQT